MILLSSQKPAEALTEADEPVKIIVPFPLSTIPGITFNNDDDNNNASHEHNIRKKVKNKTLIPTEDSEI